MAPSPPALAIPTAAQVQSFTGSLLVGFFLAWGLFGVLSTQVYIYSQAFMKDRPAIKIMVYTIFAAQLTQVVLFTNQGFQVFAAFFGDFASLDDVRESWFSACVLDGLVACAVQVFYAWRIWIISGRKIPSALILLTSIISLVGSIASGADAKSIGHLSKVFVPHILIKAGFWEASAAVCDILIAGFTAYYLKRRSPKGTQFEGTSALINRIIRMTIETGSLTASVAIATFVVTYLPGHPGYFIGFLSTLSGLYANSFMAILNSRIKYSVHTHSTTWKDGETEVDRQLPMRHIIRSDTLKKQSSSFGNRGGVLITVTQEELALESTYKQSTSVVNPQSESQSLSNEQA